MNQNDRKKFALLMAKLETAFPGEIITREKTALYFDYLDDLAIGQISRAVDFIIQTRTDPRFPLIGQIREATLGSVDNKAMEAWSTMKNLTSWTKLDPFLKRVIETAFGSVENYLNGMQQDDTYDRPHFLRAFKLLYNLKEVQKEKQIEGKQPIKLITKGKHNG